MYELYIYLMLEDIKFNTPLIFHYIYIKNSLHVYTVNNIYIISFFVHNT